LRGEGEGGGGSGEERGKVRGIFVANFEMKTVNNINWVFF
jgi:hypothetical protein